MQIADKSKYIGAKITLVTDNNIQTNYNIIGEGLCSDQSNTLIFGLGKSDIVKKLVITDIYGNLEQINDVKINTTIKIN